MPHFIPLPAAGEVLCGFDAVFQFSSGLLGEFAASRIGTPEFEVAYRNDILTDTIRDGLGEAIHGGVDSGIFQAPALVSYDFESKAFLLRLHARSFRFLENASPDRAEFTWSIEVSLKRVETAASFARRRGFSSTGPGFSGVSTEAKGPPEPVEEIIPLGSGVLTVYASPEVVADTPSMAVRAKLDHSDWVINVVSDEPLIAELLDLAPANIHSTMVDYVYRRFVAIAAVSGAGIALTPVLSFRPSPPLDDSAFGAPDSRTLTVRHKVMPANNPQTQVICIGINIGQSSGDIEAVPPFVGSGNYAAAMSEEIVRLVVQSRWDSAERSVRSLIEDIDYTVSVEGDTYSGIGSAYVLATFTDLDVITLDPGPDESMPNTLRLSGDYEIQMQHLIMEDGTVVPASRLEGDFTTPVSQPHTLHILPFSAPADPGSTSAMADFLNRLGAHLLRSIYLPFPNGGLVLERLAGSVHSPSGVIAMNGTARIS
jgi:hypothetical protein